MSTANAHPLAMTIHPPPSPFDFLSRTFSTTPLPSRIRTAVPINSPKNGDVILHNLSVKFVDVSGLAENQSIQSKDRTTAFFHNRYISSRLELSSCGCQVRSTDQFARRSSMFL